MIVPFQVDLTDEQRYKNKLESSLRKAKHLSNRMKNFISDIEKTKLKSKDKKAIIDAALGFLDNQNI